MKKIILSLAVLATLLSCETKPKEVPTDPTDTADVIINDSTSFGKVLELVPLKDSPEFGDAILELNNPAEGSVLKSNNVNFSYELPMLKDAK